MKFFNIGFKFFLVTYLIRILGKENYGLVTWLDSLIQYFLMFINFGFNIYAAKYIVDNKEDNDRLNEIVSSIFTIKGILFLLSVFSIIGLSRLSEFDSYGGLLILFVMSGIGEVLFPIWYFQGKENLKPATLVVFLSRFLLVLAVLFLVVAEHDTFLYVLLYVLSSIFMGLLGLFYLIKHYKVRFKIVSVNKLYFFVKEAIPFFVGRFLSLIFNFGTIFLIGKFCTLTDVSGFDISLKIIIVGTIPFEMLQQALFPTLARTQNKLLLKRTIGFSVIFGCLVAVLIYVFAEDLIFIFAGGEMLQFTNSLKALSIMPPFIAMTFILGSCALVAFGHFKEYNLSLIVTSVIYFLAILVLWMLESITFWNLIYVRILGEILMWAIRLFYSFKKGVLALG
jgi:PST family polysaccharide transporter